MKAEFSCIIVDDERYAIGLMEATLNDIYPNISVDGKYTTWKDGLEAIRTTDADIVFLDISIEGRSGLDLLRLCSDIDCEVIFVTAYSEYALEAFQTIAVGYLVKPFSNTDLVKTVDRALERIRNKRLANAGMAGSANSMKLAVRNGHGVDYFDPADILYLEAMKDCTRVVTKNGTTVSSLNLGKYAHILEDKMFFKVHRSYIINLKAVLRFESSGMVVLSNKAEIPVARNVKEALLAALR